MDGNHFDLVILHFMRIWEKRWKEIIPHLRQVTDPQRYGPAMVGYLIDEFW